MTGFLARMAARAAGSGTAAAPRLPSRFEAPSLPGTDAEGAPGAAAAASAGVPASGVGPLATDPAEAPVPAPSRPRRAGETERVAGRHAAPAAIPPLGRPSEGAAERASLAPVAGTPATPPAPPHDVRASASASQSPGEPARDRVVVVALPAAPAPPPRPAAAPDAAGDHLTEPGRGPDVVHVTIGRIDVRAAVAQPAPRPAPAPTAAPTTLPLADYLRGRRAAG